MNQFKTVVLLAALAALLMVFGGAIAGRQGVIVAFAIALGINFLSYWFSDKIVLSMYGAREVDENSNPEFVGVVRELAQRAGLPMPRVYIIPSEAPNAFATGRDPSHAAVAATEGILRMLNRDELAGVMSHELTHVAHRDTLISVIAATIAGAIGFIANIARWGLMFGGRLQGDDDDHGGALGLVASLVMVIVLPLVAMIIQLAISRSREYMADEGGAQISGQPLALANALKKLEMGAQAVPMDASPATAHMFIVNPLTGGGLMALFSTHPSTADRVARLEAMAARGVGLTSSPIVR